jgi:hypothetical protein
MCASVNQLIMYDSGEIELVVECEICHNLTFYVLPVLRKNKKRVIDFRKIEQKSCCLEIKI